MRRGFTLLEVMVALTVLAIISMLTFSTIWGALNARDILEANDELNQTARIALSKLRRDLSLAWLTPNTQAVNTFRTIFVAKDDSPDRVWFSALSHQRLYRDAREADQTEITLWTEDDPDTRGAYVLLRREAPRIDHEPAEGGAILPLAYKVKAFDLRYLDPTTNEWRDDWDTLGTDTPNRLPRAAQIGLVLLAPDPDDPSELVEHPYTTTVVLEYGPPLQKSLL